MSFLPEQTAPPVFRPAGAARTQADRSAHTLAYLTVGLSTLGFLGALVYSLGHGFTAVDVGTLVGMYLVTSLGVEGGFHRLFAHRSFCAQPAVTALFGIAGSMA